VKHFESFIASIKVTEAIAAPWRPIRQTSSSPYQHYTVWCLEICWYVNGFRSI